MKTVRLAFVLCCSLFFIAPSPWSWAQTTVAPIANPPVKAPDATASPNGAKPVATPVATPVPTVAPSSPVTAPNVEVPKATPSPQLPTQSAAPVGSPSPQLEKFEDPNAVLPAPRLPTIGVPTAPEVAATSPSGPVVTPANPTTPTPPATAAPTTTPTPVPDGSSAPDGAPTVPVPLPLPGEGTVQSGNEQPGGNFSLEAPGGIVYDMERGLALAQGAVTFRYREFTVRGDRGIVDYNTNRATLTGNLTVTVRGNVFTGNSLTFDLDSGRWTLSNLSIAFPPEFFPPGTVLAPIYVRDGSVTGDFDTFSGQNFKFTSCDRDHYYIKSKKLEFYRQPNGEPSRIVLRHNDIYVLGRRIIPLPVYVISLLGATTRRQPLQTAFGQNDTDGFFARSVYDLRANPKLTDSLLIDVLQKRGLGLGFQRQYAAAGILYLYALSGQAGGREIDSRVDRTYQLARGYVTNLRFDSSQNTSLTGEDVSSQNGQFSFARTGKQAQTNAIFGFNRQGYSFGNSNNGSITLDHRQNFGSGYNMEATTLLNRAQSGGTTGVQNDAATYDQTLTFTKAARAFDLALRAELHNDLVNHTAYNTERLPELTLQSTTQRLPLPLLGTYLPGNFSLGLGRFNEPSSGQRKDRADFYYNPLDKEYRLLGSGTSKSLLTAAGNFEQAFYSDNTARYNYTYNVAMNNTAGPAQLQLNYSKQRTFGFTPFQFDFTTPGEYLDYTFSLQTGEKFRFNLTGGRDIQNGFSRDLIARAQFSPNDGLYASLGTSYRLENDQSGTDTSRFGDIYTNVRIARNPNRFGGGQLAFGVRYTPGGDGLTRANGSIDVNLGKKTRFQGLAGYDGFAKKFDFTQFRITRDLHCFNLYATYDGQLKELRFDIAIKAFPFADTRFGRNQFSEGFDPSVGDVQ